MTRAELFHAPPGRFNRSALGIFLIWGAAIAVADVAALEALHAKLSGVSGAISVADGFDALNELSSWDLKASSLKQPQRIKLLETSALVYLATGDARKALEAAQELRRAAPTSEAARRLVWWAALAAGDGKLAQSSWNDLRPDLSAAAKATADKQKTANAWMGSQAPELAFKTSGGQEIGTRERRGVALVLDLWSPSSPPTEEHAAGMRALTAENENEAFVEVVSVCSDNAETCDKVFDKLGYKCQRVAGREMGKRSSPVHTALRTGDDAATFVIDGKGVIRAVTLADPVGMQYAARACIAESRGDVAYLSPRDASGKPAIEEPKIDVTAKPAKPEASGDLPSNPEAAGKLTLARTAIRQKTWKRAQELLEAIVRDYPGTKEAKDAAEYLEGLPG